MTGPTLTQADVQERLACLKELLQDVGKDIAAALTQLVLQRKKPSREDALKFLAARLASVTDQSPDTIMVEGETESTTECAANLRQTAAPPHDALNGEASASSMSSDGSSPATYVEPRGLLPDDLIMEVSEGVTAASVLLREPDERPALGAAVGAEEADEQDATAAPLPAGGASDASQVKKPVPETAEVELAPAEAPPLVKAEAGEQSWESEQVGSSPMLGRPADGTTAAALAQIDEEVAHGEEPSAEEPNRDKAVALAEQFAAPEVEASGAATVDVHTGDCKPAQELAVADADGATAEQFLANMEAARQVTEHTVAAVTEPADVAATEPVDLAAIEPADAAATEPIDAAATEPADAAATEPVDAVATEPVDAAATELADAAATEPVNAAATEPANLAATEPADAAATVPTDAAATVPTDAAATEPVDAAAIEPVDAAAIEPVDAAATEPVDAAATEPADAAATEPVNAAATEPANLAATEPADAAATEPVDAAATEPVVAAATEPVDLPATEPADAAATEPADAAATDPVDAAATAAAEASAEPQQAVRREEEPEDRVAMEAQDFRSASEPQLVKSGDGESPAALADELVVAAEDVSAAGHEAPSSAAPVINVVEPSLGSVSQ